MRKRPLIVDCDPGVDDALALLMLGASSLFDLRGITAVHGNVSLAHTAKNARFLADQYGLDCPVAKGAAEALMVRLPRAGEIHGGNGLAGYETGTPADFCSEHAWELLYRESVEAGGALEVLAIGPLTNIAITVLKYPAFADNVKRLVMMGGGATKGNSTAYAEFNIWQDPHAMEVVLAAGFKELVVVDLDACDRAALTSAQADTLLSLSKDNPLAPMLRRFREFQRDMFLSRAKTARAKSFYQNYFVPYDAVAFAVAAWPEIAQYSEHYMVCECASIQSAGQTIVDWTHRFDYSPNIKLAHSVDRDRFAGEFLNSIAHYSKEGTGA